MSSSQFVAPKRVKSLCVPSPSNPSCAKQQAQMQALTMTAANAHASTKYDPPPTPPTNPSKFVDSPVFCNDLYKAKQAIYAFTVVIPDPSSKSAQNNNRLGDYILALNGLFSVLADVFGVTRQQDTSYDKRTIQEGRDMLNSILEKDTDTHASVKQLVNSVTLEARRNSNNAPVKQSYMKFIHQLCHELPYVMAPISS